MTKVCVPGGQVPSGHLFEPLTRGYIVSEIDLPDLNPHTACSTRVEPHALRQLRPRLSEDESGHPREGISNLPLVRRINEALLDEAVPKRPHRHGGLS